MKTVNRRDFIKKGSILGLSGLFLGNAEQAMAKQIAQEFGGNTLDAQKLQWSAPWQPEVPMRLSPLTRQLAQISLAGEHGKKLQPVHWNFPQKEDPTLSMNMKYAYAALSVAQNAPLRILPGELIIGSATLKEAAQHLIPLLNSSSTSHVTPGFSDILHGGYESVRVRIQKRLTEPGLDAHGEDLLRSMLLTIDAANLWNQRNIELLEERKKGVSVDEQAFIDTIITTLRQVPERPPRNFREAVQSLWSLYAFQRLMGNWLGIGRIDQMLGSYLKEDLKKGTLTIDQAREILAHFWIKGCEWVTHEGCGSGDAQFYQNIILAGVDASGREVCNEITYLVLDIVEELHISDFPVGVRINRRTPEKLLRRIAQVQQQGGGIISLYNEEIVIEGLVKFGYPLEEAREFTNDGCWEAIIPGKTAFIYHPRDMTVSLSKALGLMDSSKKVDYADFESLYNEFVKELRNEITPLQDWFDTEWTIIGTRPNPLLEMIVEGCIEKGKGYYERGPKYTALSIHYGGVSDVANSLYALKKLVFEDHYLSLSEFTKILNNNWEGNENLRRLVQHRLKFYGNDQKEPDQMMQRVFNDYADIVGEVKDRAGVKRPCGISTFGREIDWRLTRKASPAGTRVGDVLATNCSPTPGTDKEGPTAALKSYCKLDFTKTCNGATLELKLLPDSVKGEKGEVALMGLAKTFRQLGGFYMHIDVVDTTTLIDAQKHPERYPNLPVRISGWSARFTTLSKEWQDMLIQRTQQII